MSPLSAELAMVILPSILLTALVASPRRRLRNRTFHSPEGAAAADRRGAPTVTIRNTRDGDTYEEYRLNGRVYMVRVVPSTAFPTR
jgi:hypothetical protein